MQALVKSAQEDPSVIEALKRHLTKDHNEFKSYTQDAACPFTLEDLIRKASFNCLSAFLLGKRLLVMHNCFEYMRWGI
jgi:hypothetical protein